MAKGKDRGGFERFDTPVSAPSTAAPGSDVDTPTPPDEPKQQETPVLSHTERDAALQPVRDPLSVTFLTGKERVPMTAKTTDSQDRQLLAQCGNMFEKLIAGGVVQPWAFLAMTEMEEIIGKIRATLKENNMTEVK